MVLAICLKDRPPSRLDYGLFAAFTETEHFDRIQHVNQLAEDIENHRQVSAKLRDEIGKYDGTSGLRSLFSVF